MVDNSRQRLEKPPVAQVTLPRLAVPGPVGAGVCGVEGALPPDEVSWRLARWDLSSGQTGR